MHTSDQRFAAPERTTQRFARRSALASERVYGHGYQGPAAAQLFTALTDRCRIAPGTRVLDVGSGLGGDAFRLAAEHGADVVGLDASPDMTAICVERRTAGGGTGPRFVTGDVRTYPLAPASFDLVWTRDCGMYLPVPDKHDVWLRLFDALAPGGRVLVTDYCRGSDPASDAFESHAATCGHHLATTAGYRDVVAGAGFVDVTVEDRSADLHGSLLAERAALADGRSGFLADFTAAEYEALSHRWAQKTAFVTAGELVWLVLTARKPGRPA